MNHRVRLIIIAVLMFAWAGLLFSRLFTLQVVRHEEFNQRAQQQHLKEIELTPKRGTIYDRNGKVLAINVNLPSIYVDPSAVENRELVVQTLAEVLSMTRAEVTEKLESNSRFVWIKRKAKDGEWQQLRELDLKGVDAVTESKRIYPGESLASHVLGFVNVDNTGLAGVEYSYDQHLKGKKGTMLSIRGAKRGYEFSQGRVLKEPTGGHDVHLTIDARLQQIVEEELARQLEVTQARSGTVVVMNPHTGAIRAMANMPDYDPNSRFTTDQRFARKNRAIVDAYEPGSTFKIITAVAAFEQGVVSPEDVFDCQMGSIRIGSRTIRDHHPFGELTFREIIEHSSNVGTIKVAQLVGEANLWRTASKFGYGTGTGIDLPGENNGILRSVDRWSANSYGSISIGQEVSGNPVQILMNAAVIANGGYWVWPHVGQQVIDQQGNVVYTAEVQRRRIVDESVVATVKELMRGVVLQGGGKLAQVTGVPVAGKTGTGEIAEPGKGYVAGKYLSSFIGFLPADEPELVMLCTLVEPKGKYYGGEIGAPLFANISERVVSLLNFRRTNQEVIAPDSRFALSDLTQIVAAEESVSARRTLPELDGSLVMPDLVGLSLQEAVSRLARMGVVPRLSGSGAVVAQQPSAGSRIAGNVELHGGGTEIAGS